MKKQSYLQRMSDVLKQGILLSCCIFLINCGGSNGNVSIVLPDLPDEAPEKALKDVLEKYIDTVVDEQGPGLSLMVRKNDDPVFQYSRGLANQNAGIVISQDTGFRLASISKTFTALAIMQLWESGKLALEDEIGLYLPTLSTPYQQVTIDQLLTHTSGIPDFINDNSSAGILVFDGMTNADLLRYFNDADELEFTPGTRAEYSNSGYVLLSEIVAVVAGMPFGDYMQTFIFSPAGMDSSYIIDGQFPRSTEDALSFAKNIDVLGFDSQTHGSSGQVSSINDLHRFFDALKTHVLIQEDTLVKMKARRVYIPNIDFHYGYGWLVLDSGATQIMHTGGFDGYQTMMYLDLNADLEFAVLTNGGADTLNIMHQLKDAVTEALAN